MKSINYDMLPEHMRDGARLYIEHGVPPGGFMTAVLENNLVKALARAHGTDRAAMFEWASWLYNECPGNAWGSEEIVNKWIESHETERTPQ